MLFCQGCMAAQRISRETVCTVAFVLVPPVRFVITERGVGSAPLLHAHRIVNLKCGCFDFDEIGMVSKVERVRKCWAESLREIEPA